MTARSSVYAYAMGAGAAGAIGAVCGKYAFRGNISQNIEAFFFFIAFLLANILMWWAYTKSLSLSDSTTESMVLNLGTNFVLTSFLAYLLFSEVHSLLWYFGLILVVAGISIIVTEGKESNKSKSSAKEL